MKEKTYEIIFQDEWNNLSLVGFYNDLDDAIDDINEQLKAYEDYEKIKLEKGDLGEYPSTFDYCFDREIYVDNEENVVMVRGFILDKEKTIKAIQEGDK